MLNLVHIILKKHLKTPALYCVSTRLGALPSAAAARVRSAGSDTEPKAA